MGEPACFNPPFGEAVTVFLGLGSNLGDRGQHLCNALHRMCDSVAIERVSSVYETEPVGYAEQPQFWNIVVKGRSELPARELMQRLLAIESELGRERSFPNAPRTIDIDLLLYDEVVMRDSVVQVPHPRMRERGFVLRPLLEIEPDATDPRTRERYADVLRSGNFENFAKLPTKLPCEIG